MLKKILLASAMTLACSATANASTISGTILADNGSVAVHQQGSTYTVISSSQFGNWPTPKTFTHNVADDPDSLKACKIHIIAWGDGSTAQGVMAHLSGTGGASFTGQAGSPLNNVYVSSVTHGGTTAAGQAVAVSSAAAIIGSVGAPSTGFTSAPVVNGGLAGTWGPINLNQEMEGRDQVKFVWDARPLDGKPRNFRVLSLPCDSIVKPKPPVEHVNSWEIAGQFNPTNNINTSTNPFEVWTYGYTTAPNCSGPVIPFRNKGLEISPGGLGRDVSFWSLGVNGMVNSADLPMVGQSEGSTLLSPLRFSPQGISMHPGPKNECAVVRFTAPQQGTYHLKGRFWAQNISSGGTNVAVSVARNGTALLGQSGSITALAVPTNKPFSWSGPLAAGDTLDFRVGSNGSFYNDSTGLHGYIERQTP